MAGVSSPRCGVILARTGKRHCFWAAGCSGEVTNYPQKVMSSTLTINGRNQPHAMVGVISARSSDISSQSL